MAAIFPVETASQETARCLMPLQTRTAPAPLCPNPASADAKKALSRTRRKRPGGKRFFVFVRAFAFGPRPASAGGGVLDAPAGTLRFSDTVGRIRSPFLTTGGCGFAGDLSRSGALPPPRCLERRCARNGLRLLRQNTLQRHPSDVLRMVPGQSRHPRVPSSNQRPGLGAPPVSTVAMYSTPAGTGRPGSETVTSGVLPCSSSPVTKWHSAMPKSIFCRSPVCSRT